MVAAVRGGCAVTATWLSGEPLLYPDGTVLLHRRGRCAGVVFAGVLYTHNMGLRPQQPEEWRPVEREQLAPRPLRYLAGAVDRAVAAGWSPS